MKVYCFLFFYVILFSAYTYAQDKLYLKGNKTPLAGHATYLCKNIVVFTTDSSLKADTILVGFIDYLVMENGAKISFKPNHIFGSNDTTYIGCKSLLIKMDVPFLVPNKFSISVEQSIASRSSIEYSIGVISNYLNIYNRKDKEEWSFIEVPRDDILGGFAVFGYKSMVSSLGQSKRVQHWHLLTGSYLRTEINFSVINIAHKGEYDSYGYGGWGYLYSGGYFTDWTRQVSAALILNYGYQFVANNKTAFDIFIGLGVCGNSKKLLRTSFPQVDSWDMPPDFRYFNTTQLDLHSYMSFRDMVFSPVMQFGIRTGLTLGKLKTISIK